MNIKEKHRIAEKIKVGDYVFSRYEFMGFCVVRHILEICDNDVVVYELIWTNNVYEGGTQLTMKSKYKFSKHKLFENTIESIILDKENWRLQLTEMML